MTDNDQAYANTFPSFTTYVDRAMEHLTDAELRVLLYASRHIMGWKDKIASRTGCLSLSMFEHGFTVTHDDGSASVYGGCGLSRPIISKALNSLETFGFLERVGFEQDKGQRWRLSETPDWTALEARSAERLAANQKRTAKATTSRKAAKVQVGSNVGREYQIGDFKESSGVVTSHVTPREDDKNGVVTSDVTMVVTSDVPNQTNDQTNKEKESALVASQLDAGASIPNDHQPRLTLLEKAESIKPTPTQVVEIVPASTAKSKAPRQRPRDPVYDAIQSGWRIKANGIILCIKGILSGTSKRPTWKDSNLDNPMLPPEITEFAEWCWRKKKMCPTTPETIQKWAYEFREERDRKVQQFPSGLFLSREELDKFTPSPTEYMRPRGVDYAH